jgi:hypothetical protein
MMTNMAETQEIEPIKVVGPTTMGKVDLTLGSSVVGPVTRSSAEGTIEGKPFQGEVISAGDALQFNVKTGAKSLDGSLYGIAGEQTAYLTIRTAGGASETFAISIPEFRKTNTLSASVLNGKGAELLKLIGGELSPDVIPAALAPLLKLNETAHKTFVDRIGGAGAPVAAAGDIPLWCIIMYCIPGWGILVYLLFKKCRG